MSDPPAAADPLLVARIRAGDERAFETVFREHYGPLCGYATRLVSSRDEAEEVVQSVFLRVWTQRTTLAPHPSVRAYLYAATRNQALDRLDRDDVARRWADRERYEKADAVDDASDEMAVVEAHDALHAAVARLPERARLVVTLRWLRGMSPPEIAAALGISVKGVEIQITRALRALREHLGGRGVG